MCGRQRDVFLIRLTMVSSYLVKDVILSSVTSVRQGETQEGAQKDMRSSLLSYVSAQHKTLRRVPFGF